MEEKNKEMLLMENEILKVIIRLTFYNASVDEKEIEILQYDKGIELSEFQRLKISEILKK